MKIILGLFLMVLWAVHLGAIHWVAAMLFVAVPIAVIALRLRFSPAFRDRYKGMLIARGWIR